MTQQIIEKGDTVRVTIEGEYRGMDDGLSPLSTGTLGPNDRDWEYESDEGDTVTVELVKKKTPEPKFKVGDRVRCTYPRGELAGKVGLVTRVVPAGRHSPPVYGTTFPGAIYEHRLELAPSQEFRLQVGDEIRNTKTGRVGVVWESAGQPPHGLVVSEPLDIVNKVPASAVEEYEEHYPGTYELIERDGQPF